MIGSGNVIGPDPTDGSFANQRKLRSCSASAVREKTKSTVKQVRGPRTSVKYALRMADAVGLSAGTKPPAKKRKPGPSSEEPGYKPGNNLLSRDLTSYYHWLLGA